ESQEYQRAIEVLLSLPNGLESDQVAIKALRKAREAERDRLLQSLEAPERGDSTESPSSRTTVLRIQQRWLKALGREDCLTRSNHLERRMRLELAQVQLDLGQPDAAYGTLERWRNDFIAAERPNREAVEATTALLAMAKVELARADYMQAIRRCAEAR